MVEICADYEICEWSICTVVVNDQVGVSLHQASSPNEFSWGFKFMDGVSIPSDLQHNLC